MPLRAAASGTGRRWLATESGQTIGETLAEAVRRLRQERMGDALVDYQSDADDERWLYGDASG